MLKNGWFSAVARRCGDIGTLQNMERWRKLPVRNGRWAGRAEAVISVAIQIKTGRLFKTVPPFFGCLPVVTAFAFLFAFRFVPEQIGAHQCFECVITDFAFIELMCHRAFLMFCIKTGADCSLPVRMGQGGQAT